jgi:hypothetical protein
MGGARRSQARLDFSKISTRYWVEDDVMAAISTRRFLSDFSITGTSGGGK